MNEWKTRKGFIKIDNALEIGRFCYEDFEPINQ